MLRQTKITATYKSKYFYFRTEISAIDKYSFDYPHPNTYSQNTLVYTDGQLSIQSTAKSVYIFYFKNLYQLCKLVRTRHTNEFREHFGKLDVESIQIDQKLRIFKQFAFSYSNFIYCNTI